MTDVKIQCAKREKLGSRASRKLRAAGRMIGSLQSEGEDLHLDVHFDEFDFQVARRQHVHLFDLDVDGEIHSAVIRELQWDPMGDQLVHVEFRRVIRGVAIESVVPLEWLGDPGGILTAHMSEIEIRCLPSDIPDSVTVKVGGLEPGTHITADQIELPEGIELAVDLDLEIAVISELRVQEIETEEEEEAPEIIGEAPQEAEGEGDEGKKED